LPRGTCGLSADWRKRLECVQSIFRRRIYGCALGNSCGARGGVRAVRPATARPEKSRPESSPHRHIFTLDGLTPRSVPVKSRSRSWWPGRRDLVPWGEQGTPVRIRDGPAAVSRRRGRSLQAIAVSSPLRGGLREGVRPAEPGSQKTYQGTRACRPARAGRQARPPAEPSATVGLSIFEKRFCKQSLRRGSAADTFGLRAAGEGLA